MNPILNLLLLTSALSLLTAPSASCAESTPASTPVAVESAPLPPATIAEIDRIFQQWDRRDSPGCALGLYRNGHIIYKKGYGMADLDHDVPITPETAFHVASVSKQFAAAAMILLAQQGKLSLGDDVRKYVPELPDFGERITISHLIHHTSGLRDQWELLDLAGWRYSLDLITNDDVMSVVTRQKELNFKPGEKYLYCNTGYTLMGLIVKSISGLSLREFTSKNIFAPLGMTHTRFRDDHSQIIKHNARGYERKGPEKTLRLSLTNFDTVGATSLHTTVEDLAHWDRNFYDPRVGGAEFIKQMLEVGTLNSGAPLEYAGGLLLSDYRGLPTVSHLGSDAGYRSGFMRFPEQHFTVAVLCNTAEASTASLLRKVADVVLEKDFKKPGRPLRERSAGTPAVSLTKEHMAALTGLYWNRADDAYCKILLDGDTLRWSANGATNVMKPESAELFHIADIPNGDLVDIRFEPAADGKQRRIQRSFNGGKVSTFDAVEPAAINDTQLSSYAGDYISAEIDPVYRLDSKDGKLALSRLKHKPEILEPAVRDVFTGDIGTLRFTRDQNDKISGFTLNTGRILNFRFTKKDG